MKILLFAPSESVHSLRFINWLLDRGCQVIHVDWHNPYPLGRRGYKYYLYGFPSKNRLFIKLFGKNNFPRMMASKFLVIPQIWFLWFLHKPDLVHVHYIDYRAIRCVMAGVKPLIFTAWGSDINYLFLASADPVYRMKIGLALRKADLVLADSVEIQSKCEELAGRSINSKLLYFGIDTNLFKPGYERDVIELKRKANIPQEAKILFSIRGWNRYYRHHLILEAFARALPGMKSKTYLVFKSFSITPDSEEYQSELLSLANKLNIADKVRFLDEVDYSQMPIMYALSDVIINYPLVDAFPVTFLEAAACERRVISCMLPSYKNTFAEQYFRIISDRSIDELIVAMVELINDHHQMKNNYDLVAARTFVEKNFTENVSINVLFNLYSDLSQRGSF